MPTISMFYGLIIRMLFMGNQQHDLRHLHIEYRGPEVVVSIPDGEVLEGEHSAKKLHMIQAWIAIQEVLIAEWALAVKGEPVFKIKPLR
jgi:hypothetical protein